MIPIQIRDSYSGCELFDGVKTDIVREYCDKVLDLRGRRRSTKDAIDSFNLWCSSVNIFIGEKQFRNLSDIVTANLDELKGIRNYIDNLKNTNPTAYQKLMCLSKVVKDVLYEGMREETRDYLIDALKLHVCPYCNRNYIYSTKAGKSKRVVSADKTGNSRKIGSVATCELDHYYSKGEYPMLAVSFFNLIPVCHLCNHWKGDKDLKFFNPHTSTWEDAEKIRFKYYPTSLDYRTNENSIDIDFCIDGIGSEQYYNAVDDIATLRLREVYSKHGDVAKELIIKNLIYDKSYVNQMYSEFGEYFLSRKEMERFMLSASDEIEDISNTPLGKLRADILRQIKDEEMIL